MVVNVLSWVQHRTLAGASLSGGTRKSRPWHTAVTHRVARNSIARARLVSGCLAAARWIADPRVPDWVKSSPADHVVYTAKDPQKADPNRCSAATDLLQS